jgi:hypothetical protein
MLVPTVFRRLSGSRGASLAALAASSSTTLRVQAATGTSSRRFCGSFADCAASTSRVKGERSFSTATASSSNSCECGFSMQFFGLSLGF